MANLKHVFLRNFVTCPQYPPTYPADPLRPGPVQCQLSDFVRSVRHFKTILPELEVGVWVGILIISKSKHSIYVTVHDFEL